MPLPFIIGGIAAVAGAVGIGSGVHGAVKMKEANDTIKEAKSRHQWNINRFESKNKDATAAMDRVGNLELSILNSFKDFSDTIEKINNRPQFKHIDVNGVELPEYDPEELEKVSVGAGVLLGGLGGAALGTAGGFAAAGATTAAVMALGTASTGTAIASLSGIAATNATLAALGGGAIAAGGGGIALGTTILGAATAGVGLLVGGMIFNITGSSLSSKADTAYSEMLSAEKEIDKLCDYLRDLQNTANRYERALNKVNDIYKTKLYALKALISSGKTDWYQFTESEQLLTENTVLLVGLLYNMCKVKLVQQAEGDNKLNKINHADIDKSIGDSEIIISSKGF